MFVGDDEDYKDFETEWPGLNMSLLRDIFNTHKVFEFGSFNCREYTLKEFRASVKRAEIKHCGRKHLCSQLLTEESFDCRATLFPLWLIQDDLFQVFAYFFGVSDGINRLLQYKDIAHGLDVFCCVLPRKVASLYDPNITYESSIRDLDECFGANTAHRLFHLPQMACPQNKELIEKQIANCFEMMGDLKCMVVFMDRRGGLMNQADSMSIFGCHAFSEVSELLNDHFIGIRFTSSGNDNNDGEVKLRAWLYYGNGQKLRFWPEQLIWFIPRLFVKPEMSGYEFTKRLYSDDYKHGFGVKLDDTVFERYYKLLTGWTHQSVNYRRTKDVYEMQLQFGLREYIQRKLLEMESINSAMLNLDSFLDQNAYCSDAIDEDVGGDDLHANSNIAKYLGGATTAMSPIIQFTNEFKDKGLGNCSVTHVRELWNCFFARQLVDNLVRFEQKRLAIDQEDLDEFDHSVIVRALDHLVEVHNMFSIGNRKRIQNYFMNQLQCNLGGDCVALQHHCSRRREFGDDETDEKEQKESERDVMLSVTRGVLSSAHCYLLHSEEKLYRLSGQRNKFELLPFSTPVQEEEKKRDAERGDPLSIDFGQHILQWLPYCSD